MRVVKLFTHKVVLSTILKILPNRVVFQGHKRGVLDVRFAPDIIDNVL